MLQKLWRTIVFLAVPVLYMLSIRLLFGVRSWSDLFSVMSWSFLGLVPYAAGVLTIFLAPKEKINSRSYCVVQPWLAVAVLFVITVIAAVEGIACWIMALPLFMAAASLGGLTTRYLRLAFVSGALKATVFFALLPFLIGPLEQRMGASTATYRADTHIDIKASDAVIWQNVVRVRPISAEQDKGWLTRFLGFPRPIQAELNYEGVGASRRAIFDKGLVFHEVVEAYEHCRTMRFSIKAYPYEIPSATLDEHVVIGGDYFDVLNGTYELEKISPTTFRLHLYSHFMLTTTFNGYAAWWARWIMKDIQNNILQVIRRRSEEVKN